MCYYNVSQVRVGAAVRAKTLLQSLYADTGLVQDSGFALAGLDGTIVYSSQPDLMACGTNLAGHIPASLIVESHTVPEVGTLLLDGDGNVAVGVEQHGGDKGKSKQIEQQQPPERSAELVQKIRGCARGGTRQLGLPAGNFLSN